MPITVITRLTTAIIQPTGITPITIVITTLTILTIITTITTVIIGIGITIGISVAARRRAGSPGEHFNFRPLLCFGL
jgi:hypothetical protein